MLKKLLAWIPANLASILGIAQAIVKLVKEILTAIINIALPIIPSDKFKDVVMAVRNTVNKIDDILEKIKSFLLRVTP